MSDKVKLPKNVASGLEVMRQSEAKGDTCDGYVLRTFDQRSIAALSDYDNDVEALNEWLQPNGTLSIERCGLYYAALVNGYEVEQTPEDKVRETYLQLRNDENHPEQADIDRIRLANYAHGIKYALDTLGIKISGVNAE